MPHYYTPHYTLSQGGAELKDTAVLDRLEGTKPPASLFMLDKNSSKEPLSVKNLSIPKTWAPVEDDKPAETPVILCVDHTGEYLFVWHAQSRKVLKAGTGAGHTVGGAVYIESEVIEAKSECKVCGALAEEAKTEAGAEEEKSDGGAVAAAAAADEAEEEEEEHEAAAAPTPEPPTCPSNGHAMVMSSGDYYSYSCNECGSSGTGERWFCGQCRDDYCYNCRPRQDPPAPKAPKSNGSLMVCLGSNLLLKPDGPKGRTLLLDCGTLKPVESPAALPAFSGIVCDTGRYLVSVESTGVDDDLLATTIGELGNNIIHPLQQRRHKLAPALMSPQLPNPHVRPVYAQDRRQPRSPERAQAERQEAPRNDPLLLERCLALPQGRRGH